MVCKKFQVYNWFRTLDGAKRIDFLNGILHICFPLELRFLGSCIEELARKDYTYLRDAEIKANAPYEIQQMRDISDKITRSKMIVTLALLASSNYECARLIYDLLNVDILDLLDKMKINLDEKIADEFLLLLTMAANHPAFDFQMKTKMSQLCINAEKKLKQFKVIMKESESDLCLCSTNPILESEMNTSSTSQQIKDKERNLPNDEPIINNHTNTNEDTTLDFTKPEINNNTLTKCAKPDDSDDNTLLLQREKVDDDKSDKKSDIFKQPLIESIDFEGVQMIQGTENYKFLIKIHWSDKEYNVIDKTYSELCEFNQQLVNLYPQELNGIIESSQLVFKEDQKEDVIKELPLVTSYCSKIAKLPKLVSESDFLISFFRSNLSNPTCNNLDSNSPNKTTLTTNDKSLQDDLTSTSVLNESRTNNQDNKNTRKSEIQQTNEISKENTQRKLNSLSSTSSVTSQDIKSDLQQQSEINETLNDSTFLSSKRSNLNTDTTVGISSLPMHVNTQIHSQSRPNSTNSSSSLSSVSVVNMPPNQIAGLVPQQQLPTSQPPPIINQFVNPNPNALFNPIQPPFLNMNQQLHLQSFQPIQNIMIASPSCPSPAPPPPPQSQQTSTVLNSLSLNNSRCNSPWNLMPPPPVSSALPQSLHNNHPQFYSPHHYQINNFSNNNITVSTRSDRNQHYDCLSGNFKPNNTTSNNNNNKVNLKENLNKSQLVNSNEDVLVRGENNLNLKSQNVPNLMNDDTLSPNQTTTNTFENDLKQQINENQVNNLNSSNRKSSDSFRKNFSKSKNIPLSSESLMWQNETNSNNDNEIISPKQSNNNTKETINNTKTSGVNQNLPPSITLPLHLQQQHQQSQNKQQQQPKLISPYHNNPALNAFNPTPNYHTPNTLLIQGNSQMINLPPQTQAHMTNPQTNSLLLAPIIQSSLSYSASSLPPTHPSLSQQQQQNMKYLSKQNTSRIQMERPKSPAVNTLTSDDENNDKKHNRRSSLRSSSTNSNHNKYSITRQHNSHSISSTATTIKPSSVSNASSNSSLNSNTNPRITCSNSSLSASPCSQQPNSQSVSPITNTKSNSNKKQNGPSEQQSCLSPQSLNNKQKNLVSSPEVNNNKDDKNCDINLSNESNSVGKTKKNDSNNEIKNNKDKINYGNQNSSSSSSSSISTATLTNSKSPNVSNLIPIPQHQHQQQHHMHQFQSQPSSLSSSMNNNNLFYSPVVSPFTYIDSNIYALTNGINPGISGPSTANHPLGPAIIHPFNPYQPPPPPPPQPPSSQNGQNVAFQHQLIPSQHQPYFNLIPVNIPPPLIPQQINNSSNCQPPPPPTTSISQTQHSNSNVNNNCTTPTPGSSPNPTLSTSSSSSNSSTNLNLNNMSNQQGQSMQYSQIQSHPPPQVPQQPPPPPPPQFPFDQQLLNPYNFNMVALANAVNNSATAQPLNPNIIMMMMMQNQHPGSLPPLMSNQLQPPQLLTNTNNNVNNKYNNYYNYQQYRSQTPNSLQQPSPSNLVNSNTSGSSTSSSFRSNYNQQQSNNNKKKVSCYNCGSMYHAAKDCDQPSLETMSQPTQYKLNFKTSNQPSMPIINTNTTNNSNNNNVENLEDTTESKVNYVVSSSKPNNTTIFKTTNNAEI